MVNLVDNVFFRFFSFNCIKKIFYRDMDQKLISILVDRWISTGSNLDLVHEVSDSDMERIDRSFWFVETINPRFLSKFYDAHLILKVCTEIAPIYFCDAAFNQFKLKTYRPRKIGKEFGRLFI